MKPVRCVNDFNVGYSRNNSILNTIPRQKMIYAYNRWMVCHTLCKKVLQKLVLVKKGRDLI